VADVGIGEGHAKLILTGEHSVVYGHPAIAMAINRCMTVRLNRRRGPTCVDEADVQDERLEQAIQTILPSTGFGVSIECDFPAGRGMGSSAALAVALVRAKAAVVNGPLDLPSLCSDAMKVERIFHGNPSGLDHTVSARGGLIWFQKGPPTLMDSLETPKWQVVVLDSETSGNTAEMVRRVADSGEEAKRILDQIGCLTHEARELLSDPASLGALLNENHRLLDALGVSTPTLNHLARWAVAHGAYGAKLAGAGGGGVVIAITHDGPSLVTNAHADGIKAFCASIAESTWE